VLGVHNVPGKKLFIPLKQFTPDTDTEHSVVKDVNDDHLAGLNNRVDKVRGAKGRLEAFGAHVLVHANTGRGFSLSERHRLNTWFHHGAVFVLAKLIKTRLFLYCFFLWRVDVIFITPHKHLKIW
jgi:hypothetical protein